MSFKKQLNSYVDKWKEKGIINEHQRALILKDIDSESTTGEFFRIVAIIGSLFIGLGSILLVWSYWTTLPKFVKLFLVLSLPTLSLYIGYYLSYVKQEYNKIGNSLIFLSGLLIGFSLILLATIYNFSGPDYILFLLWTILIVPLTFIYKFKSLAVLNIILFYLTVFFGMDYFLIRIVEETFSITFILISTLIITSSYYIRNNFNDKYSNVLKTFEIVSVKVLFLTLFLTTLDKDFFIFGRSLLSEIFQNLLFLSTIFFVMWFSNKKSEIILRNSTFFWLGAYMIHRYFLWFWDSMDHGLFFVLFGMFLILLVFVYIKGTKYLENIKVKAKKNKEE